MRTSKARLHRAQILALLLAVLPGLAIAQTSQVEAFDWLIDARDYVMELRQNIFEVERLLDTPTQEPSFEIRASELPIQLQIELGVLMHRGMDLRESYFPLASWANEEARSARTGNANVLAMMLSSQHSVLVHGTHLARRLSRAWTTVEALELRLELMAIHETIVNILLELY